MKKKNPKITLGKINEELLDEYVVKLCGASSLADYHDVALARNEILRRMRKGHK